MTVEPGLKGGLAVARTEPRLQVWRTVVEAYALTLGNLGYLLQNLMGVGFVDDPGVARILRIDVLA